MTRSTKAALLSGLIFPGVGHMALKHYLRGSLLMLFALIPLSVIVTTAIQRALSIIDSINSGEIPLDTGSITELVSNTTSAADSSGVNISMIVLGVCWLIGIVDSYRLGISQKK